jgi:tetratricopeptide (TPR) repeat protein
LRAEPNYADAHSNLAIALVQQARVPEAIEHWKQALRIRPDFVAAYYNLGIAMERAGKLSEAIEYYQQALKLQPDLQSASEALARLRATQ